MNTHTDKKQENKSQSIASAFSQKQSKDGSTFQFVDNRPEAIAQRKLQEMANNSPQVKRSAQLQDMADNYSAQQQRPIQKKEINTGLSDNLKSGLENLSGYSMDDVKVHYNSDKPAQLQVNAYAQGTDIHLGSGQEKHLPHEAWHVVQQKQGRVKPTMQMKGRGNINDDTGIEKEADVMGNKALQLKSTTIHKPEALKHAGVKVLTTQLYSNVSKGYIWGYGKGTGVNAPNFEFQEVSASKIVNNAASTIDYGVDANQVIEDSPELRVSDDRSLAVPTRNKSNAKSFFATQGKIAESNVFLHNAGAPLRLNQGAGQIRLSNGINPFGPTLNQVAPNLANVINNSSECGAFAQNILGTPVQNAETVNALGVVNQIPGLATSTVARNNAINTALGGQNPETLGANRNANPEVGESFGIYARQTVPPVGVATALWNGVV